MKPLLFDHNLSPKLIQRLADLYPDAKHVYLLGLNTVTDRMVWEYARNHDYIIVTKDVDFSELLLLYNFPPKIIWIRRGNCSTHTIEELLRTHFEAIETMSDDPHTGIITLF
jgi:predicted nuclease of predicted toxin-antitoxin system